VADRSRVRGPPVPLHVEQALAAGAASARVGDARRLEDADASYDAVLLLGPLYHITDRAGRIAALSVEELLGLEGPGWLLRDLDARWADPLERERLLAAARAIERERSLMGLSAHLLAVARQWRKR